MLFFSGQRTLEKHEKFNVDGSLGDWWGRVGFYRHFAHLEQTYLHLYHSQMTRFIASITRRQRFSWISHYHVLICRWNRNWFQFWVHVYSENVYIHTYTSRVDADEWMDVWVTVKNYLISVFICSETKCGPADRWYS